MKKIKQPKFKQILGMKDYLFCLSDKGELYRLDNAKNGKWTKIEVSEVETIKIKEQRFI